MDTVYMVIRGLYMHQDLSTVPGTNNHDCRSEQSMVSVTSSCVMSAVNTMTPSKLDG